MASQYYVDKTMHKDLTKILIFSRVFIHKVAKICHSGKIVWLLVSPMNFQNTLILSICLPNCD
jgi:hypothetical protein